MATVTKEITSHETTETCASDRLCQAHKIVKQNMYWSMGVGLVPIPIVDAVAVATIQTRMIKNLSDLYEIKYSEHCAKNIIATLVGTLGAGVLTAGVLGSMIKVLPFAGALIGGVLAVSGISAGVTYALGKVFIQHFEAGGTLLDLDPEKTRAYFATQFQEGRKLASEVKKA